VGKKVEGLLAKRALRVDIRMKKIRCYVGNKYYLLLLTVYFKMYRLTVFKKSGDDLFFIVCLFDDVKMQQQIFSSKLLMPLNKRLGN